MPPGRWQHPGDQLQGLGVAAGLVDTVHVAGDGSWHDTGEVEPVVLLHDPVQDCVSNRGVSNPYVPGGLLGLVQLAGAASIFVQDVIDVFEGLFEHVFVLSLCMNGCSLASLNPASPPAFCDRRAIGTALDFVRMQVAFEKPPVSD